MTWYNPLSWFRNDTQTLPDNRTDTEYLEIVEQTAYWPGSNGGHQVYRWKFHYRAIPLSSRLYIADESEITDTGDIQGPVLDTNPEHLTIGDSEVVAAFKREVEEEPYLSANGTQNWREVWSGDWERMPGGDGDE